MAEEPVGVIFNIQRFSIHDGPGIRTTVFLKGCSLCCFWCHNPEGIRFKPEIQYFPDRCIHCGACLAACRHGARLLQGDQVLYQREQCVACGACVETCFAGATEMVGRRVTVDQVMAEILADRAFYEAGAGARSAGPVPGRFGGEADSAGGRSPGGGGVTLSGGEPVLQIDFARAILERCQAEKLHTAIETAGNCPWEDLAALLPVTDLVMMDIKHLDPDRHRAATGASNRRILANARRLAETGIPILFRVPVVPTVNDTPEEIRAIAEFVRDLSDWRAGHGCGCADGGAPRGISLELLPFHRLAADKYQSLDRDYRASQLEPPTKEKMAELTAAVRAAYPGTRRRCVSR